MADEWCRIDDDNNTHKPTEWDDVEDVVDHVLVDNALVPTTDTDEWDDGNDSEQESIQCVPEQESSAPSTPRSSPRVKGAEIEESEKDSSIESEAPNKGNQLDTIVAELILGASLPAESFALIESAESVDSIESTESIDSTESLAENQENDDVEKHEMPLYRHPFIRDYSSNNNCSQKSSLAIILRHCEKYDFYIGATSDPWRRFMEHIDARSMTILYKTTNFQQVQEHEESLLRVFFHMPQCRNKRRSSVGLRSYKSIFYVYMLLF